MALDLSGTNQALSSLRTNQPAYRSPFESMQAAQNVQASTLANNQTELDQRDGKTLSQLMGQNTDPQTGQIDRKQLMADAGQAAGQGLISAKSFQALDDKNRPLIDQRDMSAILEKSPTLHDALPALTQRFGASKAYEFMNAMQSNYNTHVQNNADYVKKSLPMLNSATTDAEYAAAAYPLRRDPDLAGTIPATKIEFDQKKDQINQQFNPEAVKTLSEADKNTKMGDFYSTKGDNMTTPEERAALLTQREDAASDLLKQKQAGQSSLISQKQSATAPNVAADGSLALSQKQQQFDEQQWPKLMKAMSPLNASSRSAVGVAASSNMRADRALSVLDDPKASPDQIQQLVVADIMGIMKGGVPDAEQLKTGLMQTFGADLQNKLQYWSSNPGEFKNQAVRDRLREVTVGLKTIDNNVITQNAGIGAASYSALIARHPDWWKQGQAAINSVVPDAANGAQQKPQTIGDSVSSAIAALKAKAASGDPKAQAYLKSKGQSW